MNVARCLLLFYILSTPPAEAGKVLFFDLWKLDYRDNVELRQGEPRWEPAGGYTDPSVDDAGVYFPTVWRDAESGKWRMIHSVKWSPFTMMAAESDDGVRWRPLPVPDTRPEGGKLAPNHIFTAPGTSGNCVPMRGNESLGHSLGWKDTKLTDATNKVLRLELKFHDANIYAIDMEHHFLDAQDQWLIKDGKPVEALLFDF